MGAKFRNKVAQSQGIAKLRKDVGETFAQVGEVQRGLNRQLIVTLQILDATLEVLGLHEKVNAILDARHAATAKQVDTVTPAEITTEPTTESDV